MQENGTYWKIESEDPFDIHTKFYEIKDEDLVAELAFDKFTVSLETKLESK
jgi:hypothetical protein